MTWYKYWDEINKKAAEQLAKSMDEKDNELLVYGWNVLINSLQKMILLIVFFLICNRLTQFILTSVVMLFLRIWMGGTHRETQLGCLLQSGIMLGGGVCIGDICIINMHIRVICMFIIGCIILIYCPIINEKRGVYSDQRIRRFKIKSTLCVIAMNAIAIWFVRLQAVLISCELLESMDVMVAIISRKYAARHSKEEGFYKNV